MENDWECLDKRNTELQVTMAPTLQCLVRFTEARLRALPPEFFAQHRSKATSRPSIWFCLPAFGPMEGHMLPKAQDSANTCFRPRGKGHVCRLPKHPKTLQNQPTNPHSHHCALQATTNSHGPTRCWVRHFPLVPPFPPHAKEDIHRGTSTRSWVLGTKSDTWGTGCQS